MKQVVFSRNRIQDSLLYGSVAAIVFMLPMAYFFYNHQYENLYLLFIGTALFMAVIFYYQLRLLSKPYDKERAIAMLIDGHLAVAIGVILSCVFIMIAAFLSFGNIFAESQVDDTMINAQATMNIEKPIGMITRILAVTVMCNSAAGAFISVIVTYAGKRNQTKDKPVNFKATHSHL